MFGRLWRRLRALLNRGELDRELDAELRYHVERQAAEYVAAGMPRGEARRAALRDFGGVTQSQEQCREARGVRPVEDLRQDIVFGLRVLRRNPVFSLVAIVTLALGVGANTALFSITNAVVFRPLPFAEPERLLTLWETSAKSEDARNIVSPANYFDWREQTRSFEEMGAYTEDFYNISEDDSRPERVAGANATPSLFRALGVRPVLGRVFGPEDEQPDAESAVLLSHGLWQRRFGGDPSVVGKRVKLNGNPYAVVGVLPPDFIISPRRYQVYRSIRLDRQRANRSGRYLTVIARTRPGVTAEQARAEMNAVGLRLAAQYPEENAGRSATIDPLDRTITWNTRTTLLMLLGAVGFTLLIACANVANLLLSRAASRRKEMAVRAALGAGRLRLVRQMLTESLTLSLLGGLAGLLLAKWGVGVLVSLSPSSLPRAEEAGLDLRVLGFALLVSTVTGLAFGLVPALQASKVELTDALKSVRSTGGGRRSLARGTLVAAEVALSLVLLVGAGLLVKSFVRLTEVELGFDPARVVAADISLTYRYNSPEKRTEFFRQLLTRVEALPGVSSAAVSQSVPLSGEEHGAQFMVVGRAPAPDGSDRYGSTYHRVSEGYFKTLGVRLLRGRNLSERDTAGAPGVALINESLARRVFPGEDPLGKQIVLAGHATPRPREIVGIVSDTRYVTPSTEPVPQIYVSYLDDPWQHMSLTVRAGGEPTALVNRLREEIAAVDREVPLANVKEMDEYVSDSLSPQRFSALLLTVFAAAALGLAALGVYGVISNSVARRTHEIGIRIALGARGGDVLRLVVGQGMRPVLLGLGAGLTGAFALTRVLESLLYGVSAFDPSVFAGVSLLLAAVALVACYLPARRATRVDPMNALRHE